MDEKEYNWGSGPWGHGPHHQHDGMHGAPCCGPEGFHMPPSIGPWMSFPFGGQRWMHFLRNVNWETFMPYELAETDDTYIVTMPLPGFDTKEIEVSVKGNSILIEAKRTEPDHPASETETETADEDQNQDGPRPIVSFARFFWDKPHVEVEIPVKEEIDPDNVKAKFVRGMLTITFHKKPSTKVPVEE